MTMRDSFSLGYRSEFSWGSRRSVRPRRAEFSNGLTFDVGWDITVEAKICMPFGGPESLVTGEYDVSHGGMGGENAKMSTKDLGPFWLGHSIRFHVQGNGLISVGDVFDWLFRLTALGLIDALSDPGIVTSLDLHARAIAQDRVKKIADAEPGSIIVDGANPNIVVHKYDLEIPF